MPEPDSTPGGNRPGEEPDEAPVLRSTRLPAASASALRSSLQDQEASAAELREALDALRASLEGRPAPAEPAAAPPPPRRRVPSARTAVVTAAALLTLGGVTVAAVAAGTATRRTPSASPPSASAAPAPAPAPATTPPAATTPSVVPSSSPAAPASPTPDASRSLTTRPLPWPGGAVLRPRGLAASGPGATTPGLEVTAALDPDGAHVDVYERLVLRPGVPGLVLHRADVGRLPAWLRARGGVRDLQIELDGRAVPPQAIGASWRAAPREGGSVTRAVLRYRLTGVFLRQAPAPPGRFTLVLRPLAAGLVLADRDPVVVRINDARIGTVTCPTSRHPLCGSATGRTHTATLPGDATGVVLAQVALG